MLQANLIFRSEKFLKIPSFQVRHFLVARKLKLRCQNRFNFIFASEFGQNKSIKRQIPNKNGIPQHGIIEMSSSY